MLVSAKLKKLDVVFLIFVPLDSILIKIIAIQVRTIPSIMLIFHASYDGQLKQMQHIHSPSGCSPWSHVCRTYATVSP